MVTRRELETLREQYPDLPWHRTTGDSRPTPAPPERPAARKP